MTGASRAVSVFFRFSEFVCAAVVLGIVAWFVNRWDKYSVGPLAREIYTLVIASLSILFSLVWMIPTTHQFLLYPLDFLLSMAWFAAFGVLVNWIYAVDCGSIWYWSVTRQSSYCSSWRAAEAFSFISACFWFASFLLGVYVYHKLSDPVASDGVRSSGRRNRSQV